MHGTCFRCRYIVRPRVVVRYVVYDDHRRKGVMPVETSAANVVNSTQKCRECCLPQHTVCATPPCALTKRFSYSVRSVVYLLALAHAVPYVARRFAGNVKPATATLAPLESYTRALWNCKRTRRHVVSTFGEVLILVEHPHDDLSRTKTFAGHQGKPHRLKTAQLLNQCGFPRRRSCSSLLS